MTSKHDKIILRLSDILRESELKLMSTEYGFPGGNLIGEIDLLIYNQGTLWLFEIKSTPNPKLEIKAIKQMRRASRKFIPCFEEYSGKRVENTHYYYVNGTNYKNMDYSVRCIDSIVKF